MSGPSVIYDALFVAQQLDQDPVLAGQIQEHIGTERLLDLLNLPVEEIYKYAMRRLPPADMDVE